MARSPNSVAGVEAAGDPSVRTLNNAVIATAAGAPAVVDPADLPLPAALPQGGAPAMNIPVAERAVAGGPGTVMWRDQSGAELMVKTN